MNGMTLLDLVDGSVRKHPRKAMIEADGAIWSYGDVARASHRAAHLLESHGVAAGACVAVMSYNTPEFIVAMIAIWRRGAVLVPVNHKLVAAECRYIFDHCNAALILVADGLETVAAAAGHGAPILSLGRIGLHDIGVDDADHSNPGDHAAPPMTADHPAQILYTSGTTGRPKGCVHSHRAIRNTAMLSAIAFSMTPAERTLIAMPIWHAAPLNNFCIATLFVGGTIVLLRDYHPQVFVRSLQDDRISLYFGAPVSFSLPLALPGGLADYDFSSVRALVYGGGPIGAALSRQLADAYRTDRFFQVYGMTETGPGGTLLYPHEQQAKAGSIGRTSQPGTEMRVVRDDGADAIPGEVGEIWLRSESLMLGYRDDPAATAAAIVAGWYRTGDLARVDADGYLFIVDRLKDMIITGGENVYSREVEDALQEIDGVADCAVIGVPHESWGESVVAVLVPATGATLHHEAVRDALRDRLAAYKIPRRFIEAQALPRTPTGKVMKPALRQMFAETGPPPIPTPRSGES
ncbi:MAG TPA: AMP-binding protein [Sphingomonas sp.]|uniref:class I adenylate-forming enzyme family protein n=1 Tax=Sphingomonas sp. TaxID=28214 RepID=UPI002EDADD79